MILTRIRNALQGRDWSSVLIEFVLVVAGVLVALQVNNWNADRQKRQSERDYVLQLVDGAERSVQFIDYTIKRLEAQADDQRVLLDALANCAIDDDQTETVARALSELGKFEFIQLDRALIDGLKTSGEQSVIRSPQVREAMEALMLSADAQARTQAQWLQQTAPPFTYARQHFHFDIPAVVDDIHAERWAARNLRFDLAAVCEDERFVHAIANNREYTLSLVDWNGRIGDQAWAFQQALEAEIKARRWRRER